MPTARIYVLEFLSAYFSSLSAGGTLVVVRDSGKRAALLGDSDIKLPIRGETIQLLLVHIQNCMVQVRPRKKIVCFL